jgi:drug/metabolite transporter (DMT)-like permease
VSRLWVGLSLALLASVALNASYLMQHLGSAHGPGIDIRRPWRTMRTLLASRWWLVGGFVGMAGWGLHVIALTKAPLSLVQAFLVGGIALVAPLAVRVLGHRLTPGELLGIALMVLALVALTLGRGRIGVHSRYHSWALASYLLVVCCLGAALLLAQRRRAQALGLAGGFLYGAADVAIKALTGVGRVHGVAGILTSPWLLAAVLSSVGAFFCFQRGLQTGNALPVIALMTSGTNVASILGGLLVFGDPLGHRPAMVALHAAAFAIVIGAAWLLAPAQAAVTTAGEAGGSDGEGSRVHEAVPETCDADPSAAA